MLTSERCPCLSEQPQGIRPGSNAKTRMEAEPRCKACNGEGTLLISVSHEKPPIPTTQFDWSAVIDGHEEYGPYGWGPTRAAALKDLMEVLDAE